MQKQLFVTLISIISATVQQTWTGKQCMKGEAKAICLPQDYVKVKYSVDSVITFKR